MWILTNSKDLVESLSSQSLSVITSIKSRLKDLVTNSFRAKSGNRRFSYIVVHGLNAYFVNDHTKSKTKYTEDDIVNMINFLIDNIFIEFGGRIFQQTRHFLPIYFDTHTKASLSKNFFVKEKRNQHSPLTTRSVI